MDQDPRTQVEGICGVTRIVHSIEWVCIRKVHAKVYVRKSTRRGEPIFTDPQAEKHFMVPKWPNREHDGGVTHDET